MTESAKGSVNKPQAKDWWDKLGAIGIGTLLVAAVGGWYTFQQGDLESQSRRQELFTQMLAQREKADSELRTAMFKTLIDNYFGGRAAMSGASGARGAETPCGGDSADCQILFLELLARNFETIDIAPLFKDLDGKLGAAIRKERSRAAFRQRERLRKVARGLASRQVSALASLKDAKVQSVEVWKCQGSRPELVAVGEQSGARIVAVTDMQDGHVTVRLDAPGARTDSKDPPEFSVSFYDMPYIDNSRLASGDRVAIVMRNYFSAAYATFLDEIEDPVLRDDYRQFLNRSESKRCEQVNLRLVSFPENYVGLRDRPYLEELLNQIRQGVRQSRSGPPQHVDSRQ